MHSTDNCPVLLWWVTYIFVSCETIHSILSLLCYENLTEIMVENLHLPYSWNFTTLVATKKKMNWFEAKQHWEPQKEDGNHPKYWFWAGNTLEPNNTKNHEKWGEPPKILILSNTLGPNNTGNQKHEGNNLKCWILSRKHFGAKKHWEPWQVKGTIQNQIS